MINVEVVRCVWNQASVEVGAALRTERIKASLSREEAAAMLKMAESDLVHMEYGLFAPANVTYADIVAEYRRAAEA